MGVALLLAAIPSLSACSLAGDDPAEETPARVIVERAAEAGFGERLSFSGTFTAEQDVMLSPRVDGLVSRLHVDAGDRVRGGHVLLDLDPQVARQALDRTRAQHQQVTAVRSEAERQLNIARQLGEEEFIAATQIEERESELAIARAAEASARASAREQAVLIERHRLPAPFSGVISERLTEAGAWVARGTPVFRLVATDRVRLDLQVPQERYDQIDDGVEVRIHSPALGDASLPARIIAKVPAVDSDTRAFLLRLLVRDPEGRLLPGMSARAEIVLPRRADVLSISGDALLRQADGGQSVFVIESTDGSRIARRRTVRPLYRQDGKVAITGDLRAGQFVVIKGNEGLQEGQAVDPGRPSS
ncbi:efflux RND transporter periplasmic adaptor subunit [Aurantiacibacter flavus]|uniref:Efflux RND transporter periplasmic adaptor subunit n=1 Tax=Aurantiacibacter flavus TaxID=3145232 RepID=A0ABV0D052_9SPHN